MFSVIASALLPWCLSVVELNVVVNPNNSSFVGLQWNPINVRDGLFESGVRNFPTMLRLVARGVWRVLVLLFAVEACVDILKVSNLGVKDAGWTELESK